MKCPVLRYRAFSYSGLPSDRQPAIRTNSDGSGYYSHYNGLGRWRELYSYTGNVGDAAITPRSLEVFLAYAKDADNWGGNPLVGGNVGGTSADRGNLTQLKYSGLLNTWRDNGLWIKFTDAGKALALRHGIKIVDVDDY